MALHPQSLSSNRVYIDGTMDDAIELCFERGWTDGLPVVPPTQEKVLAFLEMIEQHPSDIIGIEPVRGRVITAEKVAINAVMAGCRPEYMPVVIAAVEAMVQPEYGLHGSSASTGGSAVLAIINGPIRTKLGFQSGHNLLAGGPEFRANATVGRALRMILINVLENHPGILDRSTLGHGGKYSFCFAEDEESNPWEPLHIEKGFNPESSTITVSASQAPLQVGHRRVGTIKGLLDSIADPMLALGPSHSELYLILPPEHIKVIKQAGWSKEKVRRYLHQKARRTAQAWAHANADELPNSGTGDELIPVLNRPEALVMVAGGGSGGSTCALISRWGKGETAASVTREIDTSRIL